MRISKTVLVWVVCSLWATGAAAQELSPRTYWPAPKGTRVAVFGYMYLTGDVIMDRSIPITDGDSRMNTAFGAYLQTFDLWGRTANFLIEQPYSWGTTEGRVFGVPARRDSSGFNDLAVTLGINLSGAPSMTPEQFQALRENPNPILGATVKVIAPTGQYYDDRLINVGANRWAVKPEFGYIIPISREHKLLLELEAGVWFFGDDDDFAPGEREQDPIYAGEIHLIKRFKPGFWASLEYNFWEGGRQTIGGNELDDKQRNSRIGGTIVVPVHKRQVIKFGYSTSVRHEFGGDYDQYLVTYNVAF